jgi:hypothetical protein
VAADEVVQEVEGSGRAGDLGRVNVRLDEQPGLLVVGPGRSVVIVASQMSRPSCERPMLSTRISVGWAAASPCTTSVSSAYG